MLKAYARKSIYFTHHLRNPNNLLSVMTMKTVKLREGLINIRLLLRSMKLLSNSKSSSKISEKIQSLFQRVHFLLRNPTVKSRDNILKTKAP